jgi:hypothetical protein
MIFVSHNTCYLFARPLTEFQTNVGDDIWVVDWEEYDGGNGLMIGDSQEATLERLGKPSLS